MRKEGLLAFNRKAEKSIPKVAGLPVWGQPVRLYGFFWGMQGKNWRYILGMQGKNWRYILRYKEGSIPTIGAEYRELKGMEKNYQERVTETGKEWHDYVTDIDYNGYKVNLVEYGEKKEKVCQKGKKKGKVKIIQKEFWFLMDLAVSRKKCSRVGRTREDALENRE